MLRERLNRALISVLEQFQYDGRAPLVRDDLEPTLIMSCTEPGFGDFSSSVPLRLAGSNASQALSIAQGLALRMQASKEAEELIEELLVVAPGYLNFHLRTACLTQVLCEIHREKQFYGQSRLARASLSLENSQQKYNSPSLSLDNDQLAATIGFDPEMVGPTSRRKPLEFMRYVYARCSSLLNLAHQEYPNVHEGRIDPPPFENTEWQKLQNLFATEYSIFEPAFVRQGKTLALPRTLTLRLDALSFELDHLENGKDSLRLFRYAYEVATCLEEFRQTVRIQTDDRALLAGALGVLAAGCQVLSNLFKPIGVILPEAI